MAIIRLTDDNFERLELLANPERKFTSSSIGSAGTGSIAPSLASSGITGSVPLFADATSGIKDLERTFGEAFTERSARQGELGSISAYFANNIDEFRNEIVVVEAQGLVAPEDSQVILWPFIDPGAAYPYPFRPAGPSNVRPPLTRYLRMVNSASAPARLSKRQEVLRFTPGVTLESNFLRKTVVKDVLFPYWRKHYPSAQWAYSNYHCLNFVTGANLSTSSVMIYPAGTGSLSPNVVGNPYGPSKAFTFDFYINPRYSSESPGGVFKAGTILHMSSCYAVSLVTGTSMGPDGKKDGFRLLLQLSSSANIRPSSCAISGNKVTTSMSGEDASQLYVSSDNSLKRNYWHHVAIRWGGPLVNNGTGSFVIDGTIDNRFVISSSSIMQTTSSGGFANPDGLFVGNFYEGSNSGTSAIAYFFNPAASRDEGVENFSNDLASQDPLSFTFEHPLNAEVHDLKIYNKFKITDEILTSSEKGTSLTKNLLFYVPPLFTKDSRTRLVLQTPFFDTLTSTEDPFNVALSFGIGGFEVNTENFVRDFVTNQYPRLLHLSAARIDTAVQIPRTANYLLYESGSTIKRNVTILPCDNGRFFPNYDLIKKSPAQGLSNIASGTSSTANFSGSFDDRFVDDFGVKDYSLINLRSLVSTASIVPGLVSVPAAPSTGSILPSILSSLEGATPEDPGISPGSTLTVLQRTHDPSSNEVVFFDMSNMFYGEKIEPGTVVLEDLCVSGTHGRMTFKVKDDSRGNLYRADGLSSHATWASIGNVLYEEGIIVIKTPHMPFFGKDAFRVSFSGHRNVYVLEVTVPAKASLFNSSTNPTYRDLAPTTYDNEIAKRFSYLTGINLHDNNFNVIGRANFAQPIIKRESDKVVVKLRMDF